MERGYIKLWRKVIDSGLLPNGPAWQLFGYLLVKATHRPYKQVVGGMTFDLQPGEVIFGRKKAAEFLNLSEQQVRTALKLLERLEIVTSKSTNKCTVISFVNWGIYQQDNQQDNQQITSNQPADNQQITSNQPADNQHLTTNKNIEHITKNIEHSTQEENIGACGEQLPTQQLVLVPEEKPQRKTKTSAKLTFGEYENVKLTQEEYDRLCRDYGEEKTKKTILFFDCYIEEKGYKSKSHNLAMRRWVYQAAEEDEARKAGQANQNRQDGRVGYMRDFERDYSEPCPF